MNPKISVIIPAYNAEKTIGACLNSLSYSTYKNFEVIVVDDKSKDNTIEIVKKFSVKLIQLKENRGPGTARNIGASKAKGSILLFIDSDVIIKENTIQEVANSFKNDIAAVIGTYTKETIPKNFSSQYQNLYHYFYLFNKKYKYITWFWTGCGAVKKTIFNKIGGFSKKFKKEMEDAALGYLISRKYKILLNHKIQVTHNHARYFKDLMRINFKRAIDYTRLIFRTKIFKDEAYVTPNNLLKLITTYTILIIFILSLFNPILLYSLITATVLFILLSINFYFFILKEKGFIFLIKSVITDYITFLIIGIGLIIGITKFK